MLNKHDFSDPSFVMKMFLALESRVVALEAKEALPTVRRKPPVQQLKAEIRTYLSQVVNPERSLNYVKIPVAHYEKLCEISAV